MSTFVLRPGERDEMYAPFGLRPFDEFSGGAPLGRHRYRLDREEAPGVWRRIDAAALVTPGGVVTWPKLGRQADALGAPLIRYRALIESDLYRASYQAIFDGLEFDVYPYNDDAPPATIATSPFDIPLLPAANYPFPAHVPVLRGVVRDAAGDPVENAVVREALRERTLTDARGEFVLPLRWVTPGVFVPIDAENQRTGETGAILIQIPDSIGISQTITIA